MTRVAIVAGMRTPFVKAGKAFKDLGPLRLARESVRGLLDAHQVPAESIGSLAYGVVVPEPGRPNLAREIVFEEKLPAAKTEAVQAVRATVFENSQPYTE